ncbi:putative baseplate wedge protein [Erwinia phage Faunus]|uniref:Putative baseplate wedge protein n=1 Tax=Erwinia phage Faunus TaxID=2182346 RepID=A0A2U8UWL2_9CAUD|nr:putative baseplate wedge protein [Erwinia phage Faunus]AWN08652.1 putative baseplate wedge protein [Erwinia phage Faunus]
MAATTYGVTEDGFVRKPLSAIIQSLNSRFTAAFGSTFVTDPASPDGQVIGIVADEIDTTWSQAQAAFNSYRPGATEGEGLDAITELTYAIRIVNRPTKVTVECSGAVGVEIPVGSTVSGGGYQFTTQNAVTIPGDVTVVCTTPGEIYVAPHTINKIETPVSGWTSVDNSEEGVTGLAYESDPALRARRDRTTTNGSATVEAIYSGLSGMDLDYVRIRDNDTGAPINGQPSGTIFVVVDGGAKNEIASVIYSKKAGGVPTYGTESVVITDRKGYPHTINFSRSSRTNIFISGTFRRMAGSNLSSVDVATSLQAAAMNYINSLSPGEPVVWSYMFGPLVASTPGIEIDSLFFALTANPTTTSTILLDIDQRAQALKENVTFTEAV